MSNKSNLRRKLDRDANKRAHRYLESELVPEFLRRNGPFIGEHLIAMIHAKRELDRDVAHNKRLEYQP